MNPHTLSRRSGRLAATLLLGVGLPGLLPPTCARAAAASPPAPAPAAPAAAPAEPAEEWYELGRSLFDQYAPPEVKAEYTFPTPRQWDEFAARLQHALEADDLAALASYEPEARAALAALRLLPDHADYADWLAERLDYIEAARQATVPPAAVPGPSKPRPPRVPPAPARREPAPHYGLWQARLQKRPVPARAAALLPVLRAAFAAEGVPTELVWLAEVESTFNPAARSPVGARGLFQLMPATAKDLGLSTFLPDERTDPAKSARASARYLRTLHGKFGDWPLALAAYNAGEGRVRRLLARPGARDFAGIAAALPAETRMYVPKVLATVQARTGVPPDQLAAPRSG